MRIVQFFSMAPDTVLDLRWWQFAQAMQIVDSELGRS